MRTIIQHATILNEGASYCGSLLISNGIIEHIEREGNIILPGAKVVDAEGCTLIPGVIDGHVHMREPGLTHKATMESETRAAAAGGVTTVMDMPNTIPQTTTRAAWEEKMRLGKERCHVNFAFYLGATNDNCEEIRRIDRQRTPGVKLFMGSSTGNMLVDNEESLRNIFRLCPTLLMTHCEDTARINRRMQEMQALYGDDPDVSCHPDIRDEEACYASTALAVRLARETGARLHVAHITTRRELSLFSPSDRQITAEACVAHLLFSREDYKQLGTRIKCNPAIKEADDRAALREALNDGRIALISTDHAPHQLSEKEGGCRRAASGMPMVQFSLPAMLTLADEGVLSHLRVVELMCHAPARLYGIERRGFIREGYQADLALLRPTQWQVGKECIQSLCGWSPMEGRTLNWRVERTWVNGQEVWDGTSVNPAVRGRSVKFHRT